MFIYVEVAISSGIAFCIDFVQPSEEWLELVKILESLQIGRLNRGLWLPPATSVVIRCFRCCCVSLRSIFQDCNDCCITIRSLIRLSGIFCHNRRSQCHSGRPNSLQGTCALSMPKIHVFLTRKSLQIQSNIPAEQYWS